MNEITLPDDTSSRESVEGLLYLADVGRQANDVIEEKCRSILSTARNRADAHAGHQAILKADRYTHVLDRTIYQRWGSYLDSYTVGDGTVTIETIDSRGDSDSRYYYTIPLAWLWMPYNELIATMDGQISDLVTKHETAKREQEAREAAQAKRLKAAHSGARTKRELATLHRLAAKHGKTLQDTLK